MKFITLTIVLSGILNWCSARHDVGSQFVSNYILNEEKPTSLILSNLCWNKNEQIKLIKSIMHAEIRVSGVSFENKYQDHHVMFIVDLDCPEADEIIRNASSNNLFGAPYRWLALTNTSENCGEDLMNSTLLADSDVVLAMRRGDQFSLVEVHRPSLNHTTVLTPRGVFNGFYHDIRPRRELYRRRLNLLGHPLTMGNVIQDSNKTRYHLPREDGLDFQNDATAKISWIIGKEAFLMLNATPRYIFTYRYGYKVNGQWSGLINDLHTGKADLGTNVVVSNPERLDVVTYTDTLAPFKVRFIFRQPPLSYAANIYSLPFSSRVWVAIGVCSVVSAAVLCVASRWEASAVKSATKLDGGIGDALFLTISALSQQGCVMEPRRNPGRITVWWVFAALMALHAAYSANIVTLLQAPSHSVTTLQQLASSKITLAAYDVDYNHFIFKLYSDPVRVAVYKKIEPEKGKPPFYNLSEGVERIRRGLFAFHCMAEQVYRRVELTFMENEKCDLMEIDFMNTFYPYAPMKKGSPYLELMRVAFKRIRETGVWSAVNRRHQTPQPRCVGHVASFSSVGANELKPVLTLMALGMAISVAMLGVEILTHSLFKRIRETGVWSAVNRRHQTPQPRCVGHVASFSSVGANELKPVLTLMALGMAISVAMLGVEILTHSLKAKIKHRKITFHQ